MKNFKAILTLILITISASTFAQNAKGKVIAVLNHASWCSICKANGTRATEAFTQNNADGFFTLIANDISDKESRKVAKPTLAKAGLAKSSQETNGTAGIITFYDAKTKKMIGQISVAHSNEEMEATFKAVREKASL